VAEARLARRIAELFFTARSLTRRPIYAGLSIALLALGIAAVTAIFAVFNATLLRPLPYASPDRLYVISGDEPAGNGATNQLPASALQLVRWRSESRRFSMVGGYTPATITLTGHGEPEPLPGSLVTAGFFRLLGATPLHGREFVPAEEMPGSGVAIISHGLWLRRFGGASTAIGRTIVLDDQPRVIVGIMPPGFSMLFQRADVWLPVALGPQQQANAARMIATVARLAPGATIDRARDEIILIQNQLGRERPDIFGHTTIRIDLLRESLFGAQRAGVLIMLGAVLLLLVIAAANTATLTLADAAARRTMTMTRLALGASGRDIAWLRIAESSVLGIVAAAVGVPLGRAVLVLLQRANPDAFAGFGAVGFDAMVVAIGVVAAAVATAVVGVPVALREGRQTLAGLGGSASRAIGDRRERRVREMLLGAQVAISLLLVVAAVVLVRSFVALTTRSPGFDPNQLVAVEMTVSANRYGTKELRAAYVERLVDAVKAVPGIDAVSTTQSRFVLNETMQSFIDIEGRPPEDGVTRVTNIRHIAPDLVRVMGLRVVDGRGIDATDRADSRPVAVVSEMFAKRYFPGGKALGQRVKRAPRPDAPWMDIVGVVADVRDAGVGVELGPMMYVAYAQQNTATARVTILARTRREPNASLTRGIERAIWSVDAAQAIADIAPVRALLARSASAPRFQAVVVGLFGGGALVLVLSGIYVLTLYGVIRRTRELGVRAALGAQPGNLVWAAMAHSLRPALAGIAVGVAAAIPLARVLSSVVATGIAATDVPLLGLVLLAFVAVVALAAFLPARRTLRIPPSVAMRG
jgi:putative ABC transport system permease protein